jgi:hypothetical protein
LGANRSCRSPAVGAWLIYYRMRRTTPVLVAAIVMSIAAAGLIVVAIFG